MTDEITKDKYIACKHCWVLKCPSDQCYKAAIKHMDQIAEELRVLETKTSPNIQLVMNI